jgi:hypothetical protein
MGLSAVGFDEAEEMSSQCGDLEIGYCLRNSRFF